MCYRKAAELVSSAAKFNPFMGFGAFAATSSSATSGSAASDTYDNLSGDLVVVLRKLAKRDITTKIKALEELNALVDKMNADEMALLMPYWPNIYTRMSTDPDRRARLIMNTVHAKLVKELRKRIAPQLKELLGPWLNSVFDPNTDVAQISRAAFFEVFPDQKRPEVLAFGLVDVLQFCFDHIVIKTPETLSDPRYHSTEEIASKYARVISGCFHTMAYLIDSLSVEQLEKGLVKLNELMDHQDRVWSKLTHEDPLIRGSFYRFLKTCLSKWPTVLKTHQEQMANVFLISAFDDKSSSTHEDMWDAVLLTFKVSPEVWDAVKQRKVLLKKFIEFVKSAGYGSVSISYPCLLVMLASIPANFIQEYGEQGFYADFFKAFWRGLSQDALDLRRFHVFMKAYLECILFLLKAPTSYRQLILDDVVMNLFEFYLFFYKHKTFQDKVDSGLLRDSCAKLCVKLLSTPADSDLHRFGEERLLTGLTRCLTDYYFTDKAAIIPENAFGDVATRLADLVVTISLENESIKTYTSKSLSVVMDQLSKTSSLGYADGLIGAVNVYAKFYDTQEIWDRMGDFLTTQFVPRFGNKVPTANIVTLIHLWSGHCDGPKFRSFWIAYIQSFQQHLSDALLPLYDKMAALGDLLKHPKIDEEAMRISSASGLSDSYQELISNWLLNPGLLNSDDTLKSLTKNLCSVMVSSLHVPSILLTRIASDFPSRLSKNASILDLVIAATEVQALLKQTSDDKSHDDSLKSLSEFWTQLRRSLGHPELLDQVPVSMVQHFQRHFHDIKSSWKVEDFVEWMRIFAGLFGDASYVDYLDQFFGSEDASDKLLHESIAKNASLNWIDPLSDFSASSKSRQPEFDSEQLTLCGRYMRLVLGFMDSRTADVLFGDIMTRPEGQQRLAAIICQLVSMRQVCVTNQDLEEFGVASTLSQLPGLIKRFEAIINAIFQQQFVGTLDSLIEEQGVIGLVVEKFKEKNQPRELRYFLEIGFKKLELKKDIAGQTYSTWCQHEAWSMCDIAIVKALWPYLDTEQYRGKVSIHLETLLHGSRFNEAAALLSSSALSGDLFETDEVVQSVVPALVEVAQGIFDAGFDPENCDPIKLRLMGNAISALDVFLPAQMTLIVNGMLTMFADLENISVVPRYYVLRGFLYLLENETSLGDEAKELYAHLQEMASQVIVDLFLNMDCLEISGRPARAYQNILSIIISYLPLEVIKRDWPFDKLVNLIGVENPFVQKGAYLILKHLTVEQTRTMSEAVELLSPTDIDDENDTNNAKLPESLVRFICKLPHEYQPKVINQPQCLGFLLGWMLIMETLEMSSFRLKLEYAKHLRTANALNPFLQYVCDLLGMAVSQRKPFDLSKWSVEDYVVENMDTDSPMTIPLLAAHLLFRTLKTIPSIMRNWHSSLKNRQLVLAFDAYVEKYISPPIITNELDVLQNLDKSKVGDQLVIKTNRSTTGSEAIAQYKFEDALIEMVVRIPGTYPIKVVEVVGLQRVGVTEERWRRWLLNCNGIMASQNGTLLDALMAWKQNIDKHFEGVEECAICYCVIGSLDRALPNKTCKTCKNRFHSACLVCFMSPITVF